MTVAQSTMVLGLGMKAMVVHRVLETSMLLVTKVLSVIVLVHRTLRLAAFGR
jgi:hypothetical protein